MITVDVPIKDPKNPPKLTFPDRCVHCGKSKDKTLPVKLNPGTQTKSGQLIQLDMCVPICDECASKENKSGNITWLPFFVAGLLACVIIFIPVWLLSPEGITPRMYAFPYVLGAFVGMIAVMSIGTLVEFVLNMLFAPVYGTLLLKRPLTVFSVFHDSEDLIGLSTRFTHGRKTLKMMFENGEIAREFIALNP